MIVIVAARVVVEVIIVLIIVLMRAAVFKRSDNYSDFTSPSPPRALIRAYIWRCQDRDPILTDSIQSYLYIYIYIQIKPEQAPTAHNSVHPSPDSWWAGPAKTKQKQGLHFKLLWPRVLSQNLSLFLSLYIYTQIFFIVLSSLSIRFLFSYCYTSRW